MSALTLSALRSELDAIQAHALTETNVESVEFTGSRLWLHGEDRDAGAMDLLRSDLEDAQRELKELTQERDELERRCNKLEAAVESGPADGPGKLIAAMEDAARFRQAASDWAEEVKHAREELRAMRKRKGIEAGVCAFSREVWMLLCYVSQCDGRYKKEASQLLEKINTLR